MMNQEQEKSNITDQQRNRAMEVRDLLKYKGLVISRVPQKTKKTFLELSKEEFCEDYGMTLKFLIDFWAGFAPMLARMDAFEIRLSQLEGNPKPENSKGIKLLNGRVLK